MDQDGDLDIVVTANYGGEDTRIYPKVTLALNNGEGVFEEVPLDYFPKEWIGLTLITLQIKEWEMLQSLFKSLV